MHGLMIEKREECLMVVQNKDAFLDNLATNLGRPRRKKGVERPVWSYNPQQDVFREFTQDELIHVLEEQCDFIHTTFKKTDSVGLEKVLKKTINSYGQSVIAANDKRNDEFGINKVLKNMQGEENLDIHIWDAEKNKENQTFAEQADVGLTFSDITLAESATITLFNNKDNGRSISLLPKTYIAIIPKSTIVPRMTQAAKHIHDANQRGQDVASCVSFISGPSNSADIEMNLIVGVHGPTKATYIVVEDK